jgi:hypothetical protein
VIMKKYTRTRSRSNEQNKPWFDEQKANAREREMINCSLKMKYFDQTRILIIY